MLGGVGAMILSHTQILYNVGTASVLPVTGTGAFLSGILTW